MALQDSPRWARIEKLCFEGFDTFRNYAYSHYKANTYNESTQLMMDSFEGNEDEWNKLIDNITKGEP